MRDASVVVPKACISVSIGRVETNNRMTTLLRFLQHAPRKFVPKRHVPRWCMRKHRLLCTPQSSEARSEMLRPTWSLIPCFMEPRKLTELKQKKTGTAQAHMVPWWLSTLAQPNVKISPRHGPVTGSDLTACRQRQTISNDPSTRALYPVLERSVPGHSTIPLKG